MQGNLNSGGDDREDSREHGLEDSSQPSAVESVLLAVPGVQASLQLFLHGPQDQFVSRCIRETGLWEPFETQLILASLQAGGRFLDVGANIGYFTVLAAHRVGQAGRVFAVEPDPHNSALLRRSLAANGLESRVDLIEAALSDTDGQGQLYLSQDNLGDHQIFDADEYGEEGREHVAIRLVHGADLLESRTDRLDLVKIDTQGSEYAVVSGLMPFLQRLQSRPCLLIELTPYSLRAAGASGRELVSLLATLGQPFWIVDHIEHELVATTAADLSLWSDNVDSVAGDEGFMNIFLGENPLG